MEMATSISVACHCCTFFYCFHVNQVNCRNETRLKAVAIHWRWGASDRRADSVIPWKCWRWGGRAGRALCQLGWHGGSMPRLDEHAAFSDLKGLLDRVVLEWTVGLVFFSFIYNCLSFSIPFLLPLLAVKKWFFFIFFCFFFCFSEGGLELILLR